MQNKIYKNICIFFTFLLANIFIQVILNIVRYDKIYHIKQLKLRRKNESKNDATEKKRFC